MTGDEWFRVLRVLSEKKLYSDLNRKLTEARALRNPYEAFYYAKFVLRDVWPIAEPLIAKKYNVSYYYMMQLMGVRIGMDPGTDDKIVNRWRMQQGITKQQIQEDW